MEDLGAALGLFLVIEGLAYAAFPGTVKSVARQVPEMSDASLRNFGVIAMIIGVALVWWIRG